MNVINKGIILLLLLFASCQNEYSPVFMGENPTYVKFKKSYELTGEITSIENLGTEIFILDTFLIFSNPGLDTLYHAYSSIDLNWLGSFIKKGEGPNELESPLRPLSGERKGNDFFISFYNRARLGIFHFNLTKSLIQGADIFQDTISLGNYTDVYRAYQLNQDEIFVDNLDFINLNQQYSIYRLVDQKITKVNNAVCSGLQDQSDIFLMAACTIFNPKQQKYAGGMMFLDQINIYDIYNPENSKAITVNSKITSLIEASRMIMPFKKEYYVDLRDSGEFLFGLYANQTRQEWATGDRPGEIHVINWDGQPICKLSTKEKLVNFDIDRIHNLLYAITENDEIYKYDLGKIPELGR
ncbi:MAG: hypothetical protein JJU34_10175 [Lunatimonas sp.]|uniref:TolB-like 6-bladed beta-propeller domain-containing protein n=1 Tax=Lunatimonas sp. TaxID=2060141 RepID=UPI00263A5BC5|nr:TolB-like 6-bladed beta-propeller domain-containing protein [Lunatimonas sp.]MCC5937639.1 hypothetical protein [Lunatimonas sp.]